MEKNPKTKSDLDRIIKGELSLNLDKIMGDEKLKFFQTKPKMATRNKKPKIITTESTVTSHFKNTKGKSDFELFLISRIYHD